MFIFIILHPTWNYFQLHKKHIKLDIKLDHILATKQMSINFQNIQFIQSVFSDYNEIKFKIDNRNISEKLPSIWKLNKIHTVDQNRS